MQILSEKQATESLQVDRLPYLTRTTPLESCQVCVIVPVKNEAKSLPILLNALTHQVDANGQLMDHSRYEVLILANNCSDDSVAIAQAWGKAHPTFQLHVISVHLPDAQACIGYARRLVMNEAYRRLSALKRDRTIIASTDGDTEVSTNWLTTMLAEFEQGVDMVCGRILTRRSSALGIQAKTSLYFLRYMAHRYLTAELEAFLDPLPHDGWPRHYQHFGANMAVLSNVYGQIGGLPEVKTQEDVAFYRRLQRIDAKIRHSPNVRVLTSARQVGRTSGGLAERLNQLAQAGQVSRAIWVESPQLTEARILTRHQLRQLWATRYQCDRLNDSQWQSSSRLLAQCLGLSTTTLHHELMTAPTFGLLLERVEGYQRHGSKTDVDQYPTVEISLANMHLRQRLKELRQRRKGVLSSFKPVNNGLIRLEALKQIQPIPLFSLTY